jgi:hypothetical protein
VVFISFSNPCLLFYCTVLMYKTSKNKGLHQQVQMRKRLNTNGRHDWEKIKYTHPTRTEHKQHRTSTTFAIHQLKPAPSEATSISMTSNPNKRWAQSQYRLSTVWVVPTQVACDARQNRGKSCLLKNARCAALSCLSLYERLREASSILSTFS